MAPTILDGDVLVIEATSKAKNEDIVLVRYGSDFTIKRFIKTEDTIRLLSDNLHYRELDLTEDKPILILGVVVGLTRILA